MGAIFRHELRNYFHSLTAYVFGAFLLAVIGIGAMFYNLEAAVSNFEFVLSFASIIFVVIVPILTMRTLAEERRQRTDQLLYSLPITTTQVVLGISPFLWCTSSRWRSFLSTRCCFPNSGMCICPPPTALSLPFS